MSTLPPKTPASSELFFSENRKICHRFFDQQEKMLELTLKQVTSSDDARNLILKTQETTERIISEFLITQERGLTLLLREKPFVPIPNSIETKVIGASDLSTSSSTFTSQSSPSVHPIPVASSSSVANLEPIHTRAPSLPIPGLSTASLTDPSGPTQKPTLAKQVEKRFLEEISRITGFPKDTIKPQSRFEDLGLDSITLAEIWAEMMEKIPELEKHSQSLLKAHSIEDILIIISKKQKPKANLLSEETLQIEWPSIREDLVDRFSKTLGVSTDTILDTSDFEDDLKIDIFTREEILECVLQPYPSLTQQLGRELLHAKNIAELELLLERFGAHSVKILRSTDGPVISTIDSRGIPTLEPVDRHLLEGRLSITLKKSEDLPHAVVLIGAPGHIFDYFRIAFEKVGIRVFKYLITPLGWNVPEWQNEIIPLDSVEGLRDALALAKNHDGKLPAVVMLAMEERSTDLATETHWTAKVEAAATAIFVFAKAVAARRPSAAEGGFVAVLGCKQMSPAWYGANGVAKSASREWPGARIKSIWLDRNPLNYSGQQLIQAIFDSPNEVDLEFDQEGLYKRKLVTAPTSPATGTGSPTLNEQSNILILGGGDGISAEIGVKLAQTYRCRIIAIGRTAWSDQNPYKEVQNENDLKRLVFEEVKYGEGENADNPDTIEGLHHRWKQISRQRSLWSTHDRVCAAGGSFKYYSAEATEYESLRRALDLIRQENGPIAGVIHGAGIIEDNLFTKKSVESFRRVLETKAHSVFHLYNLVKQDPLQFAVLLSSLTSYTGTPGQTDYAAANEILNGVAREWNQAVPYSVKSMLWSVWTETGLVGPALRLQMARMGLKGISTEEGVRLFIEELTRGDKSQDWVLFAPPSTLRYAKTLARSDALESI